MRLRAVNYAVAQAAPRPDDVPGRWHSQCSQDVTVHALLGAARYFVDIAANDPISLSNTRALERDYGWNGLCIEANPQYHVALAQHRNCTVLGAAISDEERMHDFVADGALGGLVANGTDQALRRPNYLVGGVTFGRALEAFRVPREVDYLSLDVEGAEHLVMHTFPWATHRINVLTVERPKPVLGAALRRHGYRHVCTHGPFGDEL